MTLSTKDGQREDERTELGGQFLHSLAAESFSSLLPAPLPRPLKDVFARRCRVLDKVRILAQYQGVLNLQSLQFMEL